MLFDAGPEEDAWERNVRRLRPDLASIEVIQLSHWHRDHSGGCSIRMITKKKEERKKKENRDPGLSQWESLS